MNDTNTLPEPVEAALAELLHAQLLLGVATAKRRPTADAPEVLAASKALVAVCDAVRAALAQQPAASGEPVAWFCEWFGADGSPEWDQYHDRTDPLPADDEWEDRPPDRVTPLYDRPQPAPARVPLNVDYMRSLGIDEHENLIGLRADEPRRVAKLRADPSGGTKGVERRAPLAEFGVSKWHVADFWRVMPFDLGLPNHNGTTPWGNCDLCFLKHSHTVMSLIAEKPARAVWWAAQEHSITNPKIVNGGTFRADRPTYSQFLEFTGAQADAYGHAAALADDGIECIGCTD